MTEIGDAVARYAERFHRAVGGKHHVASPVGAWLVLALAAPAAEDDAVRAELVDALGMPIDDAAKAARLLLESPPDVVALAAAAWTATSTEALGAWLATLPDEVTTGPMPSQEQADTWAREHTFGLIREFPLDVTQMVIVLCSAIACRISWAHPFEAVPREDLALPSAEGLATATMLRAPAQSGDHRTDIVSTEHGLMAAHAAWDTDQQMVVVSVIADPSIASEVVLAEAHAIGARIAYNRNPPRRVSLFDLPLGQAHSWTLAEHTEPGTRDHEIIDTILPAWSASSRYELIPLDVGFGAAGEALRRLVNGLRPQARQVAVAEYTREGFKAAAVTAIGIPVALVQHRDAVRVREARVEFTHPHAVVAVSAVRDHASAWVGMPLFSAWVAQADDAAS